MKPLLNSIPRANNKESRPCPICDGGSVRLLWQQSFQAPDGIALLGGYDVVVCQTCGMTFADHIPPQAAFDDYYRELSKYAYEHRGGKESAGDEERLRRAAKSIARFAPDRAARVLEIGCATGRLLAFLREAGYKNVFGLDPSPRCAEGAQNLYGFRVSTGTIFDPPELDQPHDVLILLGVLEHIRDLDRAVGALKTLSSAGGRIYIELPDASNLIAEQDAPFQELSTEHVNFFSPTSLRYLLEAGGFRTLHCRSEVRPGLGKTEHFVQGVFERSAVRRTGFPFHTDSEVGLARYIKQCRAMDAALRQRVESATAGAAEGLIVWGVGTHTQRLLAIGVLNPANIVAFVDSNPKYQNYRLAGISVIRPEALRNRPESILISSYGFQGEIEGQIRRMKLPNKVILLYADSAVTDAKV